VALPNTYEALQPTPLALRARSSLGSLGAAERRRSASVTQKNKLQFLAATRDKEWGYKPRT
jgi:hypothetical protein